MEREKLGQAQLLSRVSLDMKYSVLEGNYDTGYLQEGETTGYAKRA